MERAPTIDSFGEVATPSAFEAIRADDIEALRRSRTHARLTAQERLRQEHSRIIDGDFEHVAPDVDPLGSARRLAGEGDPQRKRYLQDMVLMDARTTLYEATSKNGAELFPEGVLTWHGEDFVGSDERAITDITSQGLSAVSSREQQAIRVSEHVEAVTPASLVQAGLHHNTGIITVYPPNELQNQTMVRYSWFEEQENQLCLRTQQLSLSGDSCSPDIVEAFFDELGVDVDMDQLETVVEQQLLVDHAEVRSIATVGRYLDRVADARLITGMEPISGVDPYEQLALESSMRQELLEASARSLADYCVELAEKQADPFWASLQVKKYANQLLHELSQQAPEIARRAFDEATAKMYQQAHRATGAAAKEVLYREARLNAPEIAYCGAGSCGLVEASPNQFLLGAQLGLKGSEFVYYADGNCRECGTKGLIYDMEGNAACEDCKKSSLTAQGSQDD